MQWAQRRRVGIATGIVLVLASLVALSWYVFIYTPPSCTDTVQNQNEEGVDCGGVCARMCALPRVDALWSRAVESADGVFHAVALVKNPETAARGTGVSYTMSLYDAGNILVAERRGTLDLAPGETRVVFESNVITRERTPVRAFMRLTGGVWERSSPDEQRVRVIPGAVDEKARSLTATLENMTSGTVSGIVADALLYDKDGILVTASETRVPTLTGRARQDIVFTWTKPFSRPITTSDIVVRHDVVR